MALLKTLAPLLATTSLLATSAFGGEPGHLTVKMHGMRNSEGQVLCALFSGAEGFPDGEKALQGDRSKVAGGRAACRFKDLKPGVYAVAVFHDEDGDGQMDSLLGIPTEGFGFSNNAKPGMFGPPSFEDAAFRMGSGRRAVTIKMLYL
jgi:uncharacterized protein (DUF2141 family)